MTLDALCTAAGDVLIYDTFNAAAAASSPPAASFLFGDAGAGGGAWMTGPAAEGAAAAAVETVTAVPAVEGEREGERLQGRRKRRRRARSCKNREDAESQRMTHIAVERNRRRQMNEYLAVLRSLMPESYVHRGDQASIVGGAIDFVKELEQLLQSLEAKKRRLLAQQQQQRHKPPKCDATPAPSTASTITSAAATSCRSGAAGEEADAASDAAGPPFARFFTYPQYVWCHSALDVGAGAGVGAEDDRAGAGAADIEVTLVETHASVRVMAPRRPGQLLKMVAGMQALRLTVLHLNVTTLDSLALYSLSVKVEEGCGLTTADDVAAAVHHVLCIIDAEDGSQRLLASGAAGPFS